MKDLVVLINTWDGYSECWDPMAHGLMKYWHDCPWPIHWMFSKKVPPMGIPIPILDDGLSWGEMMQLALQMMPSQYFLFLHEDYWITEYVATNMINMYAEIMHTFQIDHIQLMPSWDVMEHDGWFYGRDDLLWVYRGSDYRTSNQASLWRTQAYYDILCGLLDVMRRDVSPWNFEIQGTIRSRDMRCLCVSDLPARWPIHYVYRHLPEWEREPVVKGKWTAEAAKYCELEGIPLPSNYKEGEKVKV